MKDRIKEYMDYKSITAGELSSKLEVQRSNISHILNGRNKPGASFIEKMLIMFPDLNARWLFTGEGEMIEGQNDAYNGTGTSDDKDVKKTNDLSPGATSFANALLKNLNKPVEKIILLFTDGTFVDFNR